MKELKKGRMVPIFIAAMFIIILIISISCSHSAVKTEQPTFSSSIYESPDTVLVKPYFPVQKEKVTECSAALLQGHLIFENGYLRSTTLLLPGGPYASETYLIIWPYGYNLSTIATRVQVLDEKGQPFARVGDFVQFGGNSLDDIGDVNWAGDSPESNKNTGPYWLACPTTFRTFMPVQLPDYQSQPYPSGELNGILKVEDNLLRIHAGSKGNYLPIWPPAYTLRPEGQNEHIYNEKDQRVAKDGDMVTLAGGEVSIDVVEKYIGVPVPPSWKGPFWLVSKVVFDTQSIDKK